MAEILQKWRKYRAYSFDKGFHLCLPLDYLPTQKKYEPSVLQTRRDYDWTPLPIGVIAANAGTIPEQRIEGKFGFRVLFWILGNFL